MKRAILNAITPPAQSFVRMAASSAVTRPVLNRLYRRLDPHKLDRFYWYFAKIFRDHPTKNRPGFWELEFAGTPVRISLRPDQFWLDWDTAVSVLGRDHVTKSSYVSLIDSEHRPDVFLDIGSNYGVHTLLVACKGVQTISFEPNADCNERARQIHSENNLSLRIEQCALGDRVGEITLWFSPTDTWCGTTVEPTARGDLKDVTVPVRILDSYVDELRGKRVLIKIDAEGAEKQVLRGAEKVLSECRPTIIFECWPSERGEIFGFFKGHGYNVQSLPWPGKTLSLESFLMMDAENFIAVPRQ